MKNNVWPRPTLLVLPDQVCGSDDTKRELTRGKDWKVNRAPGEKYALESGCEEGWEGIDLPRQLNYQKEEYAFTTQITIPEDWKGSRLFLRFEGVNCLAKVYVDGVYLREHYGGFVSWDCEITDVVTAGQTHRLTIGVTDYPDGICSFHFGGIIREIYLVRTPEAPILRLHADTTFDASYENAQLKVYTAREEAAGTIELTLTSPNGEEQVLGEAANGLDQETVFAIEAPCKWDCEHPYLYTLTAKLIVDGTVQEVAHRRIGFRQLEKRGALIFLNGKELKVHGVNHHDIHPLKGRSITPELAEMDVKLFKEANVNFIRTSHYPPRPDFLDFCDENGIYVEDEIAVAFLGQGVPCRENDPAFTPHFMNQFSELIERDRSHASVLLWSLANESIWGTNFELENKYAHTEDPGRLTIFSYPITQMEDDDRADIWSMHYAGWDQHPTDLVDSFQRSEHEKIEWPVLHDESTHIPCYCNNDLRRDPGVRDFYSETIRPFYDRLFHTPGALGCAIWAGLDDVWEAGRFNPSWGVIDVWRRKKPEFWHVRKAYSPVVALEEIQACAGGLSVSVENRFNHTNLKECEIRYSVNGGEMKSICGPDVEPHAIGTLTFEAEVKAGTVVSYEVFDAFGKSVAEEVLTYQRELPVLPVLSGKAPAMAEDEKTLTLCGETFRITFDKEMGQILEGAKRTDNGEIKVLTGGPNLHLTGLALAPWKAESFACEMSEEAAVVTINGAYGPVKVQFVMTVDDSGLMETQWTVLDMPYASPKKVAMRVGDDTDSGGYEEVGVRFEVANTLDELSWEREGCWSCYPEGHIGRRSGKAQKHSANASKSIYEKPVCGYEEEELDTVVLGKYDPAALGTRDFRSMKSYVTEGSLGNCEASFHVYSDGSDSLRVQMSHAKDHIVDDTDERLVYEGEWVTVNTKNRSCNSTETWSKNKGDSCTLTFTGTGVDFVSSDDIIGGMASVYVDGELKDSHINLGNAQLMVGIARGYEKRCKKVYYSIHGLEAGEHTIRVEVNGERMPGAMEDYVFIDQFRIYDENWEGDTSFIINNEFNYPELSWGCYTKPPVRVKSGYTAKAYTQIR